MHTAHKTLPSSPRLLPVVAVMLGALLALSVLSYVGSKGKTLFDERKPVSAMGSSDPMHMIATNLW